MRRAGSTYWVLQARSKLGSYAHLYLLLFLLSIFALTSFFSAPHNQPLAAHPANDERGEQDMQMHAGQRCKEQQSMQLPACTALLQHVATAKSCT